MLKNKQFLIKKLFLNNARDLELVITELRDYGSLAKSRKKQQRKDKFTWVAILVFSAILQLHDI